jgi:hypothetical protein
MSLDDVGHDHVIPVDEALQHVLDNQWGDVVEEVHNQAARDWLEAERHVLDLLNLVSGYDREQLRESVRRLVDPAQPPDADLAPSRLFTVASEVSKLLEGASSPYAGRYSVDDDLAWVVALVEVTRAFREFLFVLRGPDLGWMARHAFDEPLAKLNRALAQGITFHVAVSADRKVTRFERKIHPATVLHAVFANWIGEYLTAYVDAITLAVCIECGRIFVRERRDNVYCSKTCQNRVAYKRKRIFEAGVLQPADVEASIDSLRAGLCLQHVRFGLGVVEQVKFPHRRIRLRFEGPAPPNLLSVPVSEGKTAEMVFEEVRASLPSLAPVGWDEVVTPTSLTATVRFLSTVRTFSHAELFSGKDGPKFYAVSDPRRLAELL